MRLLFLLTILFSLPVLGYQSSVTSTQKEIKWNYSNVPLKIINNSTSLPSSGTLIEQAIAEWNAASTFQIVPASSSSSKIQFVSDFSIYGSAVVGLTQVSYATSGVVNNASILLNEQHYDFTATPGMAVGNTIYLKDVVTHELGHFLGLSHSEVLNSSMFYQTFPGQSELSADDKAGVKSKYSSGHGTISGYVKGGNHIGIFGVHVQAISRKNGDSIAGITGEDGFFEIAGLDLNDTYYLYTSPLKNLDALPSSYASSQTEFCPSAYVSSFFGKCGRENDGFAQGISLTSSQTNVDIGSVSINCSLRVQEDYVYEKLQSSFSTLEVFNYDLEPRVEKSYVGYFNPNDLTTTSFTASDKLKIDLSGYASASSKFLKIRLVSQPLGNGVEYLMTVKKNGITLGTYGKTIKPEGTYNLDLVAAAGLSTSLATNVFEIEISAKKLSSFSASYSIPDFIKFGSVQNLPYLLVMSLETVAGPVMDTGDVLSDNSSCLDAPFTYAVEKSTANSDEDISKAGSAAAASCGTIEPPSGPGPGSGAFLALLLLGFFISALPSRFMKRDKKILS